MGVLGIDILLFLAIGLAAGWLAGATFRGSGLGYAGSMAVGILGAMLGGFLFHLVRWSGVGGALVASAAGAVALLAIAIATSRFAGVHDRGRRTPVT